MIVFSANIPVKRSTVQRKGSILMFNETTPLLTIDETCELLGIGRNTCAQLLRENRLKGFRIGSRVWKIPRQSIDEFIMEELKTKK